MTKDAPHQYGASTQPPSTHVFFHSVESISISNGAVSSDPGTGVRRNRAIQLAAPGRARPRGHLCPARGRAPVLRPSPWPPSRVPTRETDDNPLAWLPMAWSSASSQNTAVVEPSAPIGEAPIGIRWIKLRPRLRHPTHARRAKVRPFLPAHPVPGPRPCPYERKGPRPRSRPLTERRAAREVVAMARLQPCREAAPSGATPPAEEATPSAEHG